MISRVGIVTYYDSYNDGTLLQAYSVKTLLKSRFPSAHVDMIRYRLHPRPLPWGVLDFRKPRRNLYRLRRQASARRFARENICPERDQLITRDYGKALGFVDGNKCDMLVTGSDTVWQILDKRDVIPFPNVYWLPKELSGVKVAMAVSANRTRFEQLDEAEITWITECLGDYLLIGVRDDLTYNLVMQICPAYKDKLLRVPDPTFGVDFPQTEVDRKLRRAGFDLNRPIIGINLPDAPLVRALIQHYHAAGCQILPLAEYNNTIYLAGVRCVSMSPFEWAEVYKYLSLCITDRFHGTVFALKSKCPVLTIDFDETYRDLSSKTYSLLKEFGLENRHLPLYERDMTIQDLIGMAKMCEEPLNRKHIEANLAGKRELWNRYFDSLVNLIQAH